MVAYLITGSLVVEQVFNIPGLGSDFVRAALKREGGLLIGCTIVYGAMVIVFNAAVDLLYAMLDPRVRVQ
jgi:oligopeptide transport system permease protein